LTLLVCDSICGILPSCHNVSAAQERCWTSPKWAKTVHLEPRTHEPYAPCGPLTS
jgi:hypothetical protein